ncbi:MAG: lipopolysaccharide heptosyltransferase I [Epsilonproteobacteria bacterium]|nr:lipopolysaccharide heptosyltransferase I [Campylobacterota bacterium]OIO16126.1 MAG: lipopolysaccharide heptosyltransferase I [Helicobacteraceae bacterium CG1_02_36_14]PIP10321.1 MAG: lipopolysaccharide heptosyltransferase I [Sulfurimonas sp. CG23_combo_of_CG06-09_8_20_14_all_36_33]PIS26519.1 MAG: lipopolysaccharide heptosyltransferase I [Sulfurimonas sp. CG08_land_8_20_14_0_20_36_33]PIU34049.1 MAG: lipopolysaccharide heptosyltransferase I [Sulfurimonas sp. CG07_land_8_20_14_0_80_36_56]PIV0
MKKDTKRIAIVRLSALGDIVNTAVVLQFIHKKFPHAKIEWITEEVFAPLLTNHPLISAVHTLNLKKLKREKSFSLLKKSFSALRSLGTFNLIIDIQGLLKSALVARLIGENVHGYDKDSAREGLASFFYKTTSHVAYDENIVTRNTFLVADALGFEITQEMLLNKEAIFPHAKLTAEMEALLSSDKKNILLVIGASWESKKYPKECVAKLCDALGQNCIILWGSEKEREDGMWICENSTYASLAPKLSLTQLIDLVSKVDLLIGNDTGPTHMAWAQNIPSITLFGPTTTRMIYETASNIGIKSPSKVDINKIDKNDFSIKEIEVKSIKTKALELLK